MKELDAIRGLEEVAEQALNAEQKRIEGEVEGKLGEKDAVVLKAAEKANADVARLRRREVASAQKEAEAIIARAREEAEKLAGESGSRLAAAVDAVMMKLRLR